jgi:hypothetical protein
MPRYIVERPFQEEFNLPCPTDTKQDRLLFIENNSLLHVVWIHSFVSPDRKKSFCLYDAPTPEAVRQAAFRNKLPVDRITEVHLLDPFLYHDGDIR